MEGPPLHIALELVIKAITLMKCGKADGTFLIVAKMLKASGDEGAQLIHDLIKGTIHFGRIPAEWEESIIVSLYNWKSFTLELGSHRDPRLLDQAMKFLERVAENLL